MQLRQHQSELEARHTEVTIISSGTPALAQKWIEEIQTSFQFFIDPDKKAYQAYGLESSLIRSWGPRTWFAYARLMAQGYKWRGIQGDSGQLGGDFIVDRQGIIRLAHPSQDPSDRPAVSTILKTLDEINQDQ